MDIVHSNKFDNLGVEAATPLVVMSAAVVGGVAVVSDPEVLANLNRPIPR